MTYGPMRQGIWNIFHLVDCARGNQFVDTETGLGQPARDTLAHSCYLPEEHVILKDYLVF